MAVHERLRQSLLAEDTVTEQNHALNNETILEASTLGPSTSTGLKYAVGRNERYIASKANIEGFVCWDRTKQKKN